MPSHLAPGAYKEGTTLLVQPKNASKKDDEGRKQVWKCPCCSTDAILCRGPKVPPYFRHPSGSDCAFYTGGESAQHYGAKNIARDLLESDRTIQFTRACNRCKKDILVHTHAKTKDTTAKTEVSYQMDGTTYRADVAHFEGDVLNFIWEICWTHSTSRDAPVPWVDVAAMDILDVETVTNVPLTFKCIRNPFTCEPCLEIIKQQKLEAEKKRLNAILNAIEVAKLRKEQAERRKEEAEQMAKLQQEELERKRESRRRKEQAEHMVKLQQEELERKKEQAKKNEEDSKKREELLMDHAKESLLDAAYTGSPELVSEHIKNGADMNQRSNRYPHIGWTPLMLACIHGSEKVISILLEAGAKTDLKTFNGETASQLAEHYEHPTIVDLIHSYSSKAVAKP